MNRVSLVTVFSLIILSCFANNRGKNILAIKDEGNITKTVVLLDTASIIKFEGDSIMFLSNDYKNCLLKDSCISLSLAEVSSFNYLEEYRSEFKVRVWGDENELMPVPDCRITLHNEDMADFYGIVQFADRDGVATFSNLPTGYYELTVEDTQGYFKSSTSEIFHRHDDEISQMLIEIVLSPIDLNIEYMINSENLYEVFLHWRVPSYSLGGSFFNNYEYIICLDDHYVGQTPELRFILEDITPGEHSVSLTSISRFGNKSDSSCRLSFALPEVETSVGKIDYGFDSYHFYDLSGHEIKEKNLKPGIYVRVSSSGKTEKIIVK